jgi:hypothetical protein
MADSSRIRELAGKPDFFCGENRDAFTYVFFPRSLEDCITLEEGVS